MKSTIKTTPYWWEDEPPGSGPQSDIIPECDVIIVGAGYTGLSAALTLCRAGKTVQVFEKDLVGAAASSRNGGITSGSLRPGFVGAAKRFGESKARAMFLEAQEARLFLKQLIDSNKINCDYQLSGLFTGALTQSAFDEMKAEADIQFQKTGIETEIISKDLLHRFVGSSNYAGGIANNAIGTIHPAKLVAGLHKVAVNSGALVHDKTAVVTVRRNPNGFHIETQRGVCSAAHVIIATNGYGDDSNKWLQQRLVPVKSRIVVTEELSPNLVANLIPSGRAMGERKKLYRYFRPTPDGKRILMGGREPPFGNSLERSIEHGRLALTSIFPQLEGVEITHSWSGNVAFSRTNIPQFFEHEGIHYAVGFCGSGTVWAPWLGNKVAQKILGRPESTSIFESAPPPKVPLYRGKPWFIPAVIVGYGLQDWFDSKK